LTSRSNAPFPGLMPARRWREPECSAASSRTLSTVPKARSAALVSRGPSAPRNAPPRAPRHPGPRRRRGAIPRRSPTRPAIAGVSCGKTNRSDRNRRARHDRARQCRQRERINSPRKGSSSPPCRRKLRRSPALSRPCSAPLFSDRACFRHRPCENSIDRGAETSGNCMMTLWRETAAAPPAPAVDRRSTAAGASISAATLRFPADRATARPLTP
jgi:hypothetical protein